jgi:DNA-binding NtrC family response regulator
VRELQNAIERAFALSRDATIEVADLPPAIRGDGARAREPEALVGGEMPSLAVLEERAIRAALDRTGGNKNQAARMLGIDRQRLYRKIAKYGIA